MKSTTIIIVSVILAATITAFFIFKREKPSKQDFTIELLEIQPQTKDQMSRLFDQLEPIFIETMLPIGKPIFYDTDPRVANISFAKRKFADPKITTGMTKGLITDWHNQQSKLYTGLENKQITAAYLAIAKDLNNNPIGFALYQQISVKEFFEKNIENVLEGSLDTIKKTLAQQDTIYVSQLAVQPDAQKKGVGKVLVFSVLNHYPQVKKIYLTTLAHPLNHNAKAFFEHIGFKRILTGEFALEKGAPEFLREKILYMYKR